MENNGISSQEATLPVCGKISGKKKLTDYTRDSHIHREETEWKTCEGSGIPGISADIIPVGPFWCIQFLLWVSMTPEMMYKALHRISSHTSGFFFLLPPILTRFGCWTFPHSLLLLFPTASFSLALHFRPVVKQSVFAPSSSPDALEHTFVDWERGIDVRKRRREKRTGNSFRLQKSKRHERFRARLLLQPLILIQLAGCSLPESCGCQAGNNWILSPSLFSFLQIYFMDISRIYTHPDRKKVTSASCDQISKESKKEWKRQAHVLYMTILCRFEKKKCCNNWKSGSKAGRVFCSNKTPPSASHPTGIRIVATQN